MAKNIISLKLLAARALCKKRSNDLGIKEEQLFPDLVVAEGVENISNIKETIAFAMANMGQVSQRTNLVIHLVFKESKMKDEFNGSKELPDFSKEFLIFPNRIATLEIHSFADNYGGFEMALKVSNGILDPNILLLAVECYRRTIGLRAKLIGVKGTFQFLRPNEREDSVEGRGFRMCFKPRRTVIGRPSMTTLELDNYIRYFS